LDEDALEPDSDKINVERVFLITLQILKNVNEKGYTHFELKAPHEMYFGDWFRLFILSYNERDSENPIQYKYLDNSGIGWVFYTKPTFWRSKRFIDPSLSFVQNGLNDKATIIASRVKINFH
jgi:Type VI secretion system, TssN